MIRVILKQTLTHNGIPVAWLAAQPLVTKSRSHATGLHIRFSVRHWDVRLMQHAFDFQDDFNDRLLTLDPDAESWLFGYSWQFQVPGMVAGGMPHPGSWTAAPRESELGAKKESAILTGGRTDVISGPTVITRQPANDVDDGLNADLEALKALRLFDSERSDRTVHTFAATEPSTLRRQ